MVIEPSPELESVLNQRAQQSGIAPEALVVDALTQLFLARPLPTQPRDEWERSLLAAARHCGLSLPDSAFSSDSLYD